MSGDEVIVTPKTLPDIGNIVARMLADNPSAEARGMAQPVPFSCASRGPETLFVLDMEGRILYAGRMVLDAIGYEFSELAGKSWWALCLDSGDVDQVGAAYTHLLKHDLRSFDMTIGAKDGFRTVLTVVAFISTAADWSGPLIVGFCKRALTLDSPA